MNKRIIMVVMTAAVVTTTTGCGPFRNFFFGRGAECGLCNRTPAPFTQAPLAGLAPKRSCFGGCFQRGKGPAAPPCNNAPQQSAPCQCAPAPCQTPQVCDPCVTGGGYGPVSGSVTSGYGDPYTTGAVGNGIIEGAIIEGQPIYGDGFVPAPVNEQGVRANYPSAYDTGYKVDKDGLRIIHEDPLPPNVQYVN